MTSKTKKIIFFIGSFIIIIALFITLKLYKRPIVFEKTFGSGAIVKDNNILNDNVEIRLNGSVAKTDFLIQELKFRKNLNGNMIVDNVEYKLFASNLGEGTDNLFWGELKKNNLDTSPAYIVFISDDLNRIYLNNDKENFSISAPTKNIKEFQEIRKEMIE